MVNSAVGAFKETNPMRIRFTIRDLLWLTALVAMGVGWWLDHRAQSRRISELEDSAGLLRLVEQRELYEKRISRLEARIEELKQETSAAAGDR